MRLESRRISSQHRQLDTLFRFVAEAVDRRTRAAARAAFARFHDALDAHLSLEESFYFPALHGLHADLTASLTGFVEDHRQIRQEAEACERALVETELPSCADALGRLAETISEHEAREEEALRLVAPGPSRE
jgi:iron-sulfur cluster repair protein YtfE (RIC family)